VPSSTARWRRAPATSPAAVGDGYLLLSVVNKHHGDIRVQREPGKTEFNVLLPVEEAP
jgi:nitrogen-specific signal transduction histidine kinase